MQRHFIATTLRQVLVFGMCRVETLKRGNQKSAAISFMSARELIKESLMQTRRNEFLFL
jgi:hypothetical protein